MFSRTFKSQFYYMLYMNRKSFVYTLGTFLLFVVLIGMAALSMRFGNLRLISLGVFEPLFSAVEEEKIYSFLDFVVRVYLPFLSVGELTSSVYIHNMEQMKTKRLMQSTPITAKELAACGFLANFAEMVLKAIVFAAIWSAYAYVCHRTITMAWLSTYAVILLIAGITSLFHIMFLCIFKTAAAGIMGEMAFMIVIVGFGYWLYYQKGEALLESFTTFLNQGFGILLLLKIVQVILLWVFWTVIMERRMEA